jgi:hypothetical protein
MQKQFWLKLSKQQQILRITFTLIIYPNINQFLFNALLTKINLCLWFGIFDNDVMVCTYLSFPFNLIRLVKQGCVCSQRRKQNLD